MKYALVFALTAMAVTGCGAPGNAASDEPATARWTSGTPVGLYLMTRFWPASGSLEKAVWYFAPDGTVYRGLATGFSREDLAAHQGKRGSASRDGDALVVAWSDGSRVVARLSTTDTGFGWDAGIFTPVAPIRDAASIAGRYEGGNAVSGLGGSVSTARTIVLEAGGTYHAAGAASLVGGSTQSTVAGGASGEASGTWEAHPYAITLIDAAGRRTRMTAFPYDDRDTDVAPDYLFLGGTMYQNGNLQ